MKVGPFTLSGQVKEETVDARARQDANTVHRQASHVGPESSGSCVHTLYEEGAARVGALEV